MVLYTCYKCCYDTKHKCNMKSHLERINKCKGICNTVKLNVCKKYILQGLSYVEYKEIIDNNKNNIEINNNLINNTLNNTNNTIKYKNNTINCVSNTIEPNKYKCSYCDNVYNFNSGLHRHLKTCKVKNSIVVKHEDNNKLLNKDNNNLKTEIELLKNKLNEYDEEIEELNYIISQKNKIIKENKSINKYTNSNTTNMNCNNNNTTNNIVINNYNTPNRDYIGYDIKKECIYTDYVYLMPIMKDLFFNKEHPENHSISYSNMRSGNMSVYNGNEWILQNRVDIINDIINNCDDILSEFINDIRDSDDITYKQKKMINLYDKYISKYTLSDEDYKSLNEYIYMESKNLNIKPVVK